MEEEYKMYINPMIVGAVLTLGVEVGLIIATLIIMKKRGEK